MALGSEGGCEWDVTVPPHPKGVPTSSLLSFGLLCCRPPAPARLRLPAPARLLPPLLLACCRCAAPLVRVRLGIACPLQYFQVRLVEAEQSNAGLAQAIVLATTSSEKSHGSGASG